MQFLATIVVDVINLGIDFPCPASQHHVQTKPYHTTQSHDHKHQEVAFRPYTSVTSVNIFRNLCVVQVARDQSGEEERTQRKVQNQDVVQQTVVLQTEQLRCNWDCYSQSDAIADTHQNGTYVERSW